MYIHILCSHTYVYVNVNTMELKKNLPPKRHFLYSEKILTFLSINGMSTKNTFIWRALGWCSVYLGARFLELWSLQPCDAHGFGQVGSPARRQGQGAGQVPGDPGDRLAGDYGDIFRYNTVLFNQSSYDSSSRKCSLKQILLIKLKFIEKLHD